MKPVIFFDFDHTIFDTSAFIDLHNKETARIFRKPLEKVEKKEGIAFEEVMATYGRFTPEELSKTLARILGDEKKWRKINKFFSTDAFYKKSVFPETKEILKKLRRFRLGLFSQGNIEFQKQKFERSSLSEFFEPDLVFLLDDKISEIPMVVKNYNVFAALDDKVEVVEAWAKAGVPLVIRVRRGRFAEGNLQSGRPNIHEVKNLSEAYEIIRRRKSS